MEDREYINIINEYCAKASVAAALYSALGISMAEAADKGESFRTSLETFERDILLERLKAAGNPKMCANNNRLLCIIRAVLVDSAKVLMLIALFGLIAWFVTR